MSKELLCPVRPLPHLLDTAPDIPHRLKGPAATARQTYQSKDGAGEKHQLWQKWLNIHVLLKDATLGKGAMVWWPLLGVLAKRF